MNFKRIVLLLLVVVSLSSCATIPTGPSVMVWPGPGKPFEVFQSDDVACRQWASQQVGGQPSESANKTLASGAAVGTLLGAGLGAAIGAATGQFGAGLGIGAASGAIVGTAAGIGPSSGSGWEVQRRYDHAYMQCMYAKGNQVPGAMRPLRRAVPPPPPPPGFTPPPSSAYPPPPP
jgi:hypothetical protein